MAQVGELYTVGQTIITYILANAAEHVVNVSELVVRDGQSLE